MPKSADEPVRISPKTQDEIRHWSRYHNGYRSIESSFRSMLKLAQKLTGTLRPTDSLTITDTSRTLAEFLSDTGKDRVVARNFLSFLYRDANGVSPHKPSPFGVEPERPFEHENVFLVPRHQFEFLLFARKKAVTFGADPGLTVHDVAAAIVDNLQHVSRDGRRFYLEPTLDNLQHFPRDGDRFDLGKTEFEIRRVAAPSV